MFTTGKYMTPHFAEELRALMGCAAERGRFPPEEFLEEALRPLRSISRLRRGHFRVYAVSVIKRVVWEGARIQNADC